MNPYPGDNSVLILDNCRIHKTNTLREIIADNGKASIISFDAYSKLIFLVGCLLMFLPAYSPDLNPIEPVWHELKKRLRALPRLPTTITGLQDTVRKIWQDLPIRDIKKHTSRMDARVHATLQAKGGHTMF